MPVAAEHRDYYPYHDVGWLSDPVSTYPWPGYSGSSLYVAFGDPGLPFWGSGDSYYQARADGGFVPPPANLSDLQQRGLKSTMPIIKAELSLVNSIIELKDFVSLPKSIREAKGLYNRLTNIVPTRVAKSAKYRKGRLRRTGQTLRELVRQTAGGYLQYKFNISPLISDIAGIVTALHRLEARINDLVTRSGRVQRRHFAYNWKEFTDFTRSSSGYYPFELSTEGLRGQITAYGAFREAIHDSSTFHYEVEYNYNFTQYQLAHAQVLGLLDYFGVNLNPAIIWNGLKWTFVIDWLIGVSRFLDDFKVSNMEPKINIRQVLWSIKRRREVRTWTQLGYNGTQFPGAVPTSNPKGQLPVTVEVAYRRDVGTPTESSLLASGLSSGEFTLGAALVLSHRRRNR